jgi:hypothetical protein
MRACLRDRRRLRLAYGACACRAIGSEERVVGIFHEEIDVVLETVKVGPRLGFVDIPQIIGSAAQHDRQIRVTRLRHRERKIARERQAIGGGGAKNSAILCCCASSRGTTARNSLAAFSQQRQPRIADARRERRKIRVRPSLRHLKRAEIRLHLRRRQPTDGAFVIRKRSCCSHARALRRRPTGNRR